MFSRMLDNYVCPECKGYVQSPALGVYVVRVKNGSVDRRPAYDVDDKKGNVVCMRHYQDVKDSLQELNDDVGGLIVMLDRRCSKKGDDFFSKNGVAWHSSPYFMFGYLNLEDAERLLPITFSEKIKPLLDE